MNAIAAADLAAILRADPAAPPPETLDESTVDQAIAHGVAPLLFRALRTRGAVERLRPEVAARLSGVCREAALIDAIRSRDLAEVGLLLADAGIRPIVFKGAALASSHYPEPALRPRGDSDLLVRAGDAAAACRLLEARGFTRVPRPQGSLVTQQARYVGLRAGMPLAYDVHWRIADPHAFRSCLTYDELFQDAEVGPVAGMSCPSAVHALLIACVHRVAHHYDTDNLILLYDIHLVARRFTPEEWGRFADLAEANRLRAICLRGLGLAAEAFGTELPAAVAERLRQGTQHEPSAAYLARPLRRIDILRSDLIALNSWSARFSLLRQHLLPGTHYLQTSAGPESGRFPLIFYLARAARGARGWFVPLQ